MKYQHSTETIVDRSLLHIFVKAYLMHFISKYNTLDQLVYNFFYVVSDMYPDGSFASPDDLKYAIEVLKETYKTCHADYESSVIR